jgi:hypothetical protein
MYGCIKLTQFIFYFIHKTVDYKSSRWFRIFRIS